MPLSIYEHYNNIMAYRLIFYKQYIHWSLIIFILLLIGGYYSL